MNPKGSWWFCRVTRNHLKIHKTKWLVVNLSCVIKPVKPISLLSGKRVRNGFNSTSFTEERTLRRRKITHLEQYWLFLCAEEILYQLLHVAQENLLSFTGSIAIADVKHECTLIVIVLFCLIAHSC